MTVKRVVLSIFTVAAVLLLGGSLWSSWSQPQVQSRLELSQTNLLLQATQWEPEASSLGEEPSVSPESLLGENPYQTAIDQYQSVRDVNQNNLERLQKQLQPSSAVASEDASLPSATPVGSSQEQQIQQELQKTLAEIDLRLGLLQAYQDKIDVARSTWQQSIDQYEANEALGIEVETAKILQGLYDQPVRLLPEAEAKLQENLDGWFRYVALAKLYSLQERDAALADLQAQMQAKAESSIVKLSIVSTLPLLGFVAGSGVLLFLGWQRLFRSEKAVLKTPDSAGWEVPWNWEIPLQVFVVGFFLVSQLVIPLFLPLLFQLSGVPINNLTDLNETLRAVYILLNYVALAAGGLGVLYFSVRQFAPLPSGWFRFQPERNWFWWGFGGYLAAVPLVILVSLINQQIWEGRGGSNPLIRIALESNNVTALAIFFITASIAAPIYEEIMFRGFLLPSLTRYTNTRNAIFLSSALFAISHSNLSEVLPLATLGVILGFVYARSRNLLSSILLHSLWNSGTLLTLYILGSGLQ
ncbi:type II CAAX endopeptidase family protein [Geitlerinema sp. PCC 9228]|jgi:membrane protease YdiL (CAAX protease family)|uniref:CPBP family intramembrane glutamic endopeptidase n=1 Tax=Geitlerinema sp. PCC 9228 TaxID=111611 RepID=UPI0008F98C91|nr:type II CAAX endopeptidase family protein [Geitlerinema sp. PCC 9228]